MGQTSSHLLSFDTPGSGNFPILLDLTHSNSTTLLNQLTLALDTATSYEETATIIADWRRYYLALESSEYHDIIHQVCCHFYKK